MSSPGFDYYIARYADVRNTAYDAIERAPETERADLWQMVKVAETTVNEAVKLAGDTFDKIAQRARHAREFPPKKGRNE